jgi:hypothetical protein
MVVCPLFPPFGGGLVAAQAHGDGVQLLARQAGASNERWFHERVFDWHLWRSRK